MLSSSVCNDLPIVNPFHKLNISKKISEDIFIFFDVELSFVCTDFNALLKFLKFRHLELNLSYIPSEMRYDGSYHFPLPYY
jgi:hypothetical protein